MRIYICIILSLSAQFAFSQELKSVKKQFHAMGSAFEITAVSYDAQLCERSIEAAIQEIDRIERSISSWDPGSQTSEINANAGIKPVSVDDELFELIRRCQKIARLTNGAFDISYASMDRIWTFDGSEHSAPDSQMIANSVKHIGFDKIKLNEESRTVFLPEKGMKIGFGGIGKGFAAMSASRVMREMDVAGGIVNAGGDLYAWGQSGGNEDWSIAIADPKEKGAMIGYLELSDQAIVTSGDYERYVVIDGRRYAHIIDPRTGWPASGLKSVSIICPDAELADALATAVFVMGKENGLYFINQLSNVECLLIDDKDQISTSENLSLNLLKSRNHEN